MERHIPRHAIMRVEASPSRGAEIEKPDAQALQKEARSWGACDPTIQIVIKFVIKDGLTDEETTWMGPSFCSPRSGTRREEMHCRASEVSPSGGDTFAD